jgi:hypothetical protein
MGRNRELIEELPNLIGIAAQPGTSARLSGDIHGYQPNSHQVDIP